MAYNRELSQLASLVDVGNVTRRIGFSTDLNVSGIITATRFYGSGRFLTDIIASSIPSSNASQSQILYTNNGGIEGSELYYNNLNSNVGVGTSLPTSKFHVVGNVLVSGVTTSSTGSFTNLNATNLNSTNLNGSGISTVTYLSGTNLNYSGISTITRLTGTNLNYSGISTITSLTGTNLNYSGVSTISDLVVTNNVFVSGVITSTDYNSTSDINLKENVQVIDNSLNKILQIRGVTFEWKETHKQSAGVIAQEVESVFPELVNGIDPKTVNYNGLIGVLVEAIKELKKEVDDLKSQINK